MSKSDRIKKLLEQAINNVNNDRKIASTLLEDVSEYIGSSQEKHREVGITAAKYLEVLQKSNEQLVKIVDLIDGIKDDEYGDLDKKDKQKIYEEFEELPEKVEFDEVKKDGK